MGIDTVASESLGDALEAALKQRMAKAQAEEAKSAGTAASADAVTVTVSTTAAAGATAAGTAVAVSVNGGAAAPDSSSTVPMEIDDAANANGGQPGSSSPEEDDGMSFTPDLLQVGHIERQRQLCFNYRNHRPHFLFTGKQTL